MALAVIQYQSCGYPRRIRRWKSRSNRRHSMSSVRKIGIVVGITGLVLAMASGTGFAVTASISFDECTVSTKPCPSYTDGQPTVTTAGLTGTGGIGSPTISYQVGGEGASVIGSLLNYGAIPTGTR